MYIYKYIRIYIDMDMYTHTYIIYIAHTYKSFTCCHAVRIICGMLTHPMNNSPQDIFTTGGKKIGQNSMQPHLA